jgi:hypothetical protein
LAQRAGQDLRDPYQPVARGYRTSLLQKGPSRGHQGSKPVPARLTMRNEWHRKAQTKAKLSPHCQRAVSVERSSQCCNHTDLGQFVRETSRTMFRGDPGRSGEISDTADPADLGPPALPSGRRSDCAGCGCDFEGVSMAETQFKLADGGPSRSTAPDLSQTPRS